MVFPCKVFAFCDFQSLGKYWIWVNKKQNKDSEVALTMKIAENKIVLLYGEGWEAYFRHKEYQGFIEIIVAVEGKLQTSTTSISKKGAGKSYGKRENY